MSTIASPRDPSAPFPRRAGSAIITPTSSSRPSLDVPASASGSPNPNASSSSSTPNNAANPSSSSQPQSKRANRAALREYYNLRANAAGKPLPSPPTVEVTDPSNNPPLSPGPTALSELDAPTFAPGPYLARLLASASLADLLRTHARVLAEMRALDAEKKALVYDNYSKLIAATETIRRMRDAAAREGGQGGGGGKGGGGMGQGVEEAVRGVYERALGVREEVRAAVVVAQGGKGMAGRAGEVVKEVVKVPGRVARLVREGRVEEARREWEVPRRLLVSWQERGVGGEEVGELIEEGDRALRGVDGGEEGGAEET